VTQAPSWVGPASSRGQAALASHPSAHARTYRLRAQPAGSLWRPDTVLIVVGALLLLSALALAVYPRWAEWRHQQQRPPAPQETLPARLASAESPHPSWGEPGPAVLAARPAIDAPVERPVWMVIPRIGVDSSIMEMDIQGDTYQVPSFDVGHHADSAKPGQAGNQVYNGHLETIDAGRVFARLHELTAGDAVYVYTATHRFDWVVQDLRTVPNSARDFLEPTSDPRLTLYTCAGTFDLRTGDYTHRLVVVGRLVQAMPRAGQADTRAPSAVERAPLVP